ncbi:hypothetical protein [Asticcacaulis sp. YBE204]|uniref:hypothetical protein n=1 Tax=Asticcacaulis sp. YBE204 TaxID=1282363 RepID=UPI0003C40750|nr:hypothetical protein [Asticcacaulis sp. YBE204]ESQ78798.1 hypothetical protein AEYBE204_12505 [Asticcacaulis sp. YBE204]
MLVTVQDMIAWGLLVLPLIVIAWAAVWHAEAVAERNRHERYQRFYAIMQQLGRDDTSWAEKMAAAYELRQYKDYRHIIGKIFEDGKLREEGAQAALQAELKDLSKS